MTNEKIPQLPNYLKLNRMNEEDEVYEHVSEEGPLTAGELKILNLHGYVYQSEVNDVDFDYEDEDGIWRTGSQDIYYFTKIQK